MLSDLKKIWSRCLKRPSTAPSPNSGETVKKPDVIKKPPLPVTKTRPEPSQEFSKNDPLKAPPALPSSPKRKPLKASAVFSGTDKHGVPKIRSHEDLDRLLYETLPPSQDFEETDSKMVPEKPGLWIKKGKAGQRLKGTPVTGQRSSRLNKNGLPIISNELNLLRAFTPLDMEADEDPAPCLKESLKSGPSEESFEELLEMTLSTKSSKNLLKEKDSLYQHGKRIPLIDKIRRYPAPESELDLHGWTAVQAEKRADTFIRNSFRTGKMTLRIIVGKGLHSEDGAVLPDVVEEKVLALKKENIVLSYRWENRIKSKSGSMIVYLV